ncbi:MAG: DUF72 domain-containing protein [Bacteroidota bacterium]
MKFGKLSDISQVNFQLPTDPKANGPRIDRYQLGSGEKPRLYLGATGWSMKEWKGKWYPEKAKTTAFLQHYGQQFNTIELNTTHYRIPTPDTIQKWYQETPADFRFCPKIPQTISHRNDLGLRGEDTKRFIAAIDGLQEKMGCAFIQLPPYFDASRLPTLDRFLGAWPQLLPIAVEVRHESWFNDPTQTESLIDTLANHRACAVITDVAGRRDVLHMYVTAPRTMIRFVGNGLHPTDFERLMDWTVRLRQWRLPEVYFFPHEPDNLLAPDATAWLYQQLKQQDWAVVRGPKEVLGPPVQGSLF